MFLGASSKQKGTLAANAETSSPPNDERVVFGTARIKKLVVITASIQAARFNQICTGLVANTLVAMLDRHILSA